MKLSLVVGLPGSGKTHTAKLIAIRDGNTIIVDDIKDQSELPDADCGQNIVVTDPNFCDPNILAMAKDILGKKYPGYEMEIYYFENDPEKARANVEYRNDGRYVDGTIERFTKIYNPPEYALQIWVR